MFDKKEYMNYWHNKNKEKEKQYRIENKETIKKRLIQWRKDNPGKVREQSKRRRKNHHEEEIIRVKIWRKANPEKIKKTRSIYVKNKRRTNLKYNLNRRMVSGIGTSLKKNKAGRHWETIIGYTLKDLIGRLKKTMPENYTWQDFLGGELHIDHIVPKSVFNFTKSEHPDFKRCWALENLQLLPAKENHKKSNKLSRPFQPALKIC